MNFIQTNKPGAIRDPYSKAIHFVDNKARTEFLEKQKIQNEINTLRKSVEELSGTVAKEIQEIKALLLSAISRGNS